MPPLTSLVERLRGEAIAEKVTNQHRLIRSSFPLDHNTVRSYQEMMRVLLKFEEHYARRWLNAANMPEDHLHGHVVRLLQKNGSLEHLVPRAYRGLEGGMAGIIDELAQRHEQEAVRTYVTHVLDDVDPLDWDTQVALLQELLHDVSGLVSHARRPGELAHKWKDLIMEHAQAVTARSSSLGRWRA
jgi:hypothetical protein